MPVMPKTKPTLLPTDSIPSDPAYFGLRVVRCQSDPAALEAVTGLRYEFQHQPADYTPLKATLCLKGALGLEKSRRDRLVAVIHPTLKLFTDIIRYDPSNPPPEDYEALQMKTAHDKTQSDFKGQKSANKELFKSYVLEGLAGNRTVYLPTISGWQSVKLFPKTIFVAYDEEDPNALYGMLYLPKSPIMQADGQTQTAALFAVAHTADAVTKGALDKLTLTLEIELNVDEGKAGQSFADRNGRGSKKNRNLVIGLDSSSPLSDLRVKAVAGTVFEGRIADGRSTGTSETATTNVVDLSTMEQMLLSATVGGRHKPEMLRHFHVSYVLPYATEFLKLLHQRFAAQWPKDTPPKQDTFRRLYVHGWPFALKAIALAYFESRIDVLGPIANAVSARDAGVTLEEAFKKQLRVEKENWDKKPEVTFDQLSDRLSRIDWLRYRKHWIDITGAKLKGGKRKTFVLKSTDEEQVLGQAQNTATVIHAVKSKILSDSWEELTKNANASIKAK
jgi:hypothetical protein